MFYQNDITDIVADRLEREGWEVTKAYAQQRKDSVVAVKGKERLIINSKGETSSDPESSRFGKPFDNSQAKTQVGDGLLRLLDRVGIDGTSIGLALPDNPAHRNAVSTFAPAYPALGLRIYWVAADRGVTIEP
jgi:hypothetical protein